MLRLYDTLSRNKVEFKPLEAGKVGIYVCGPTVYDISHVGHARCYVSFDVVVRHLRHRGFAVNYVRNITDVDDKIIDRANESGEPALELSARMAAEYHADMALLGNHDPDVEPKVSAHLEEIVTLTQRLIERGHAYEVDGDVYFEVESFRPYGALSGRNLEDQQEGARVEVDPRKRHPYDFALWKKAKTGEPAWPSPWGDGRPGWHIECSAMSSRYLGERFDIHGGGMDLIFPHHENEIAQSQAANGEASFARHWMHNGFINVTTSGVEEKMSKSLGNFFTIREVCEKHDAEALRLFLLSTHYRSPLTFEVEGRGESIRYPSLEEAEQRLAYGYTTLARLDRALSVGKTVDDAEALAPADTFTERFDAAMDDDFNSAAALGHSSELLSLANRLLDQPKSAPKNIRRFTLQRIRQGLAMVADVLGIYRRDPDTFLLRRRDKLCAQRGIATADIEAKIAARTTAREAKAWARADALRAELTELGVEVMDHAGGSSWRVVEAPLDDEETGRS